MSSPLESPAVRPRLAPVLVPVPVASAAASFQELPAALHQHIATYLPARALVHLGGVSRCRDLYLSEARGCLQIGKALLEDGFPKKMRKKQMEWVIRHATILARLLQRMPRLQSLHLDLQIGLDEVLGHALLLLPGPTQLSEINFASDNYDWAADDRLHPFLKSGPHPFFIAMARGKLPFLRKLLPSRLFGHLFKGEKPECDLLSAAIIMGHLPRLTDLDLLADNCKVLLRAFTARLLALEQYSRRGEEEEEEEEVGEEEEMEEEDEEGRQLDIPNQAMVKHLIVAAQIYDDVEPLSDLLRLPLVRRLKELSICVVENTPMVSTHAKILTAYIRRTGGAPFLRHTRITFHATGNSGMDALMAVLAEGGAPGLTHISLTNFNNKGASFFDFIYRAEGLAILTELTVHSHCFDEQGMVLWMAGVLVSAHKGSALKTIIFKNNAPRNSHWLQCNTEEQHRSSLRFVEGLEAGAFPCLEVLDVPSGRMGFMKDSVAVDALVKALTAGAPCAQTLKYVRLPDLSEEQEGRIKHLLPNWDASARCR